MFGQKLLALKMGIPGNLYSENPQVCVLSWARQTTLVSKPPPCRSRRRRMLHGWSRLEEPRSRTKASVMSQEFCMEPWPLRRNVKDCLDCLGRLGLHESQNRGAGVSGTPGVGSMLKYSMPGKARPRSESLPNKGLPAASFPSALAVELHKATSKAESCNMPPHVSRCTFRRKPRSSELTSKLQELCQLYHS